MTRIIETDTDRKTWTRPVLEDLGGDIEAGGATNIDGIDVLSS